MFCGNYWCAEVHGFGDTGNYGTVHAIGQSRRNPYSCFAWEYLKPARIGTYGRERNPDVMGVKLYDSE